MSVVCCGQCLSNSCEAMGSVHRGIYGQILDMQYSGVGTVRVVAASHTPEIVGKC